WASGPAAAPSNDTPSIEASIGPASNGFAVRVKNTGKSNLKNITVYVYNASGSLVLTSTMYPGNGGVPPGQTISDVVTGALGPGQYTVKLVVQNDHGRIVVAALHAVVAGGGGHGH
ncbi:MAG: hypothetical protein RXR82_08375, partial [Nitrososphaeria archaeon]